MKIDLKVEALRQSWLFHDLGVDQIQELAAAAVFRHFGKGEFIFYEGDPPNFLYVITAGKVKQFKTSVSGRPLTTAINSPGDPLNAVALFGGKSHFVTTQTMSETNTLCIGKKEFLSFVGIHPIIMTRIIHTMGMIINSAYERLSDFAGETASERVLNVLYMLFFKFGDSVSFTREEIADMAGTTPETTIRVLRSLKTENIIESKRGGIVVLDKIKLRDVCRRSYLVPLND